MKVSKISKVTMVMNICSKLSRNSTNNVASIVNILMPTLDATKWNLGTNEQIPVGKNTKHDIRG
jgi:hypothetical protein